MSKKHIFSLPDDVLTSLFVEWSHVHNISLLDSAFCNKTDRIIFLNFLSFFTEAQPDKFLSDIYDNDIICGTAAPFGVVKDFCVEFQERGTPHSHYLINIELTPAVYFRF
jgi:hypothetical protein